jgi:GTP cyclohydrolase I
MKVRDYTDPKAIEAIKYLMEWVGEDPNREGMLDTPKRFLKAWGNDFFMGYGEDPKEHLARTFEEVGNYDSIIVLKDIPFSSYCEHHLVPIIGTAHIGYIPNDRVAGISKLARVLDGYAKRFQVQERLTEQVSSAIEEILQPKAVGVVIEAQHLCISTRGANKPTSSMVTSSLKGAFFDNQMARKEFFDLIK